MNQVDATNQQDAFGNLLYQNEMAPQLAAEAENQWLGGNLGANGSSSVGASELGNAQASLQTQAYLNSQQYMDDLVNNFLNERNNYFGTDIATGAQQNAANVQSGLNLDQLNEGAAAQNASSNLAAQTDTAQLNQNAMNNMNNFGLTAAQQLDNYGLTSAQTIGNWNHQLTQQNLAASAATANNNAKLLTGGIGDIFGLGNTLFGSGGYLNSSGGSGSGSGSGGGGSGTLMEPGYTSSALDAFTM